MMRTCKIAFIVTIFSFFCISMSSYAADVAKIGVVDFQRILETSSAGKDAQIEINKQGKKMEADLKEKGDEIEELKKKLERETLVMSKEMREEKEREVRIKINDFKTLQKKYLDDFKGFEAKLVRRIQEAVFNLVDDIGKKEGYLLIVEKRQGGVLYAPNSIDITDQLIQQYNTEFSKTADKE
ncbi:MAG: OmpH family outer membrane protein [Desulfobacterales bacterium]|nr:OmpH family outer membrane protein [Desulfobacterales bacterium]